MAEEHPTARKKKWLVAVSFLAVFALVIVFGPGRLVRPRFSFASQDDKADPNNATEQELKKSAENKPPRPLHTHRSFSERIHQRQMMVARQIRARDVQDANVLAAMRTVPRHAFVRGRDLRRAYYDHPLAIGYGQTISQPYIVAYMTESLKLDPNSTVLEVGTGSAYQAAVCAEIAREVYTIEIIEELAASAKSRLKELGYTNVFARAGDGYYGWKQKVPFDAIIITAAAPLVPPPLIEQLKPGGRMILPLGSPYGAQTLVLITKDDKGKIRSKSLLPVRFVPMIGHVTKADQSPEK